MRCIHLFASPLSRSKVQHTNTYQVISYIADIHIIYHTAVQRELRHVVSVSCNRPLKLAAIYVNTTGIVLVGTLSIDVERWLVPVVDKICAIKLKEGNPREWKTKNSKRN